MRTELNSVIIIYWQVGDETEFPSLLPGGGGAGLLNSVMGGGLLIPSSRSNLSREHLKGRPKNAPRLKRR